MKVGDKVECVYEGHSSYLQKGGIHTVNYVSNDKHFIKVTHNNHTWPASYFKLLYTPHKWNTTTTYRDQEGRSYSIKYIEPTHMWVMWCGETKILYKLTLEGRGAFLNEDIIQLLPPTCHCCGKVL